MNIADKSQSTAKQIGTFTQHLDEFHQTLALSNLTVNAVQYAPKEDRSNFIENRKNDTKNADRPHSLKKTKQR